MWRWINSGWDTWFPSSTSFSSQLLLQGRACAKSHQVRATSSLSICVPKSGCLAEERCNCPVWLGWPVFQHVPPLPTLRQGTSHKIQFDSCIVFPVLLKMTPWSIGPENQLSSRLPCSVWHTEECWAHWNFLWSLSCCCYCFPPLLQISRVDITCRYPYSPKKHVRNKEGGGKIC